MKLNIEKWALTSRSVPSSTSDAPCAVTRLNNATKLWFLTCWISVRYFAILSVILDLLDVSSPPQFGILLESDFLRNGTLSARPWILVKEVDCRAIWLFNFRRLAIWFLVLISASWDYCVPGWCTSLSWICMKVMLLRLWRSRYL